MRNHTVRFAFVLALAAGIAPTAFAQDSAPAPPTVFSAFVGTWTASGTMTTPDMGTVEVQGSWTCERAAADFAVLCRWHMTGPEGLVHHEVDLFGQDLIGDQALHWYSVTADGFAHDHVGSHGDDGFTFENLSSVGGTVMSERIHITETGDGSLHFDVSMVANQTEAMRLTLDATRN